MSRNFSMDKSYLDERGKLHPFMQDMILFYKGLIDIWGEASPDDLSPLFPPLTQVSPPFLKGGEGGLKCMLKKDKIKALDFTNSISAAKKIFKLFEQEKKDADIECAGASPNAIIEFIKNGLASEERHKNAILKWILKPSFEHTLPPSFISPLPFGERERVRGCVGGICPLCASPPGMALVFTAGQQTPEQRILSCCFCGYRWPYPMTGCPACGNDSPEKFGFFVGDSSPKETPKEICDQGVRAVSCEECKTYLKTIFIGCRGDNRAPEDLDMDIEDVATLHLDIIANQRGYKAVCQR